MRFSCKLSGLFVLGIIAGMFMHTTHSWADEATTELPYTCMTATEFDAICTAGTYCCPNGLYKTTYGCPTGWTLNSSTNTCTRNNVTTSDAAGRYTETYGSCAPSTTRVECCTESAREINGTGSCYLCPALK